MALWREGRGGDAAEEAADADDGVTTDDEEEYEEAEGGNRLLGFMFGNVDDSGDLDVDYLDEDAKEHLAALADKLGSSLEDIDLTIKSTQVQSEATDQDYDTKAENAVDYEDIDEEYEGPEVENGTEAEHLLPKKDFYQEVSLNSFEKNTVLDDDNYDFEDDDFEKQKAAAGGAVDLSSSGDHKDSYELLSLEQGHPAVDHVGEDMEEGVPSDSEESLDVNLSSLLPVLYVEDGKAILRLSEIFGIHEPMKRAGKRDYRYIVPREKYKFLDTSDIVEEDEEVFLKEPCQDLSWLRKFQKKCSVLDPGDDNDIVELRSNKGSEKNVLTVFEFMEPYASAEPMKDGSLVTAVHEQKYSLSPQFYPLDQEDWEERIIWNETPLSSDSFVESCELAGPDSDILVDTSESAAPVFEPESQTNPHEKDQISFFYDSSCVVEPFSLEKFTQVPNQNKFYPQLLRLEPLLDQFTSNTEGLKDPSGESQICSAVMRRFSQLALQNTDINDGSWLDSIIWEPSQPILKPKRIYDLQDELMLFELLDLEDGKNLQVHSGAMIVSRPVHPAGGDLVEQQHNHGASASGRFNISNDKFYFNKKSSQQLRSHSKKRSVHGLKVLHSVPALKLQTMKTKLSNKDIANFHRPKALWYPHDIEVPFKEQGRLAPQGAMKIILKSLGGKGSKLHVDDEEAISSVKVKASKKLDFKLSEPVKIFFSGKELEENKSLVEQNVHPNSVLHLIRTKIHLLPRAQKLPRENKSLRPPGAFKKKSDLSVKDGHVYLMEYCEERPLLLGNSGMGARLCTYYQKSSPADQMGNSLRVGNNGLGSVIVLDPADKSPFLGDIRPGSSQTCLETNMYRAPIFQHKVPSTDYLLVRSSKGKLSIRRIDRIDVVGQQEPHVEVMSPGSKNVQFYLMNRLLVYMFREFRDSEKRGLRPSIRADELFSQFPNLSEALLRKRLKNCADLQKGPNGHFLWVMKHNFRIPSEEELRRMVTPENVCAYESMQAGLYRLKRLGITRLMHPTGIPSAMNQLPDEAITLAAASHIERELQITPWNLSSNFVACTSQDRENIERLEITGVGDPSGRGLGFSYVRATPKAPISNATLKKKTLVGKGSTVTGTDADLRRLSMEAARELLLKFGVPEEQILKLTRWHRIALIRKLSSEQAASGVKVHQTMVSKFARGQRMSFLQLQQQTREKCQEIWERQVHSLCSGDGEENESESDANSDLDSFAGDLENLLDAEEFEEEEVGNDNAKIENSGGVRGLKMRRRSIHAQAEEEIEDEAAEAAELCKMLMDDDEADWKKKKKKAGTGQGGLSLKSRLFENADGIKNSTISKRVAQSAGSISSTDKVNKDQKGDGWSVQKNLSGKSKPKKKIDMDQMGFMNTKVKILGEAISALKEKKPARESFICGACGQLGHMRTNKHCPKYGEDTEARGESADMEKLLSRTNSSIDQIEQGQQKPPNKKVLTINGSKTATFQAQDDDRITTSKAKVLKVKCGPDKVPDKQTPATSQSSDTIAVSDTERKYNKITFSSKMKSDDFMVESSNLKPSVGQRSLVEAGRDSSLKKNVIRQPNEIFGFDDNSQDGSFGFDFRKTKKITELSSFDLRQKPESRNLPAETSRVRVQEDSPWWYEEQMREATSQSEEKNRRAEKMRIPEPAYELLRYGESIRREREEEERQRVKAKKKKKRKHERTDDYLDSFPPKRNDRKMPERERPLHRVAEFEYGAIVPDSSQPLKRRRGGEVGLSNILESIVDKLKARKEVSYLFLKPVSKKEAPDYLQIISRPMDLSTIREKVRRMEYKNRDEFRNDVNQIRYNAHKYNVGRNPGIPPLGDELLEFCDYLLEEYDAELTEAEAGIE